MNNKPQYDLLGQAPGAELDFFADADSSIGEIIYGYSSCKVSDAPPSGFDRFFTGMIGAIIGVIVAFLILKVSESIDTIWEIALYGALGGLGYFFSKAGFRKSICYVGTEGIEWIDATKTRKNIKYREVFLFKNATDFQLKLQDKYKNGQYEGSYHTYRWFRIDNDKKTTACEIWGYFYVDKKGKVSLKEYPKFHYCKRAEELWTKYLWHHYVDLMQKEGFADFYIMPGGHFYRNQFIRLGTNYIELHWGNKIHHLQGHNLHDISIQKFELRLRSAGLDVAIPLFDISNKLLFSSFMQIVQIAHLGGFDGTSYESFQDFYSAQTPSWRWR